MQRFYLILIFALTASLVFAEDDVTRTPPSVPVDNLPSELNEPTGLNGFSAAPEQPVSNAHSAAKIELGRKLFFDPILSRDNSIACASCHRPDHGFANDEKLAVGIEGRVGTRNVPTILNRGYGEHFSWDGKSTSLEEQVLVPITNPNELDSDIDLLIEKLRKDTDYVKAFSNAFGDSDGFDPNLINPTNLAKSIAAFERVLVYDNTKVDRFRSSEYKALSREARQGMWLFESRGGCWKCHNGENFTDEDFHNTGVGFGGSDRDLGRFGLTKDPADRFKFKTPTLRGVEFTAPYMHDGSVATLEEVVQFYNRGGAPDDTELDEDMKPLNLTDEEVQFLVEFLKALSK